LKGCASVFLTLPEWMVAVRGCGYISGSTQVFVSLSSGTHSLRYFYTAVSGIRDFPEFTAVGLVDEGQFMYFDSKAKEAVPKTEWIRENEGADYWDSQTQGLIGSHQIYKNNIQTLKELFNQSAGKLVTNLTDTQTKPLVLPASEISLYTALAQTSREYWGGCHSLDYFTYSIRSTATLHIIYNIYYFILFCQY